MSDALIPNHLCKKFAKLPYDLFNPAVKSELKKRSCEYCSSYFGTITTKDKHKHACTTSWHTEEAQAPAIRVRPVRVAARRGGELLCVMRLQELEWIAAEDVDVEGMDLDSVPDAAIPEVGTPIAELPEEDGDKDM